MRHIGKHWVSRICVQVIVCRPIVVEAKCFATPTLAYGSIVDRTAVDMACLGHFASSPKLIASFFNVLKGSNMRTNSRRLSRVLITSHFLRMVGRLSACAVCLVILFSRRLWLMTVQLRLWVLATWSILKDIYWLAQLWTVCHSTVPSFGSYHRDAGLVARAGGVSLTLRSFAFALRIPSWPHPRASTLARLGLVH